MQKRHDEAMLALAAVALVLADCYQPRFLFFPVQAFHLAWVFFVAGHALSLEVRALARKLLLLAALWAAFALAARLTGSAPDVLFPAGRVLTAALAALLVVQVVPGPALVAAATLCACLVLLGDEGSPLLVREAVFALAFVALGRAVRLAPERVREALASPWAAVLAFTGAELGPWQGYDLRRAVALAQLAVTLLLVVLLYTLSALSARLVQERSALLALGRAAVWVAVLHPLVFVAVNAALSAPLLQLGFQPALNRTWLLYVVPALAAPAFARQLAARAVARGLA